MKGVTQRESSRRTWDTEVSGVLSSEVRAMFKHEKILELESHEEVNSERQVRKV